MGPKDGIDFPDSYRKYRKMETLSFNIIRTIPFSKESMKIFANSFVPRVSCIAYQIYRITCIYRAIGDIKKLFKENDLFRIPLGACRCFHNHIPQTPSDNLHRYIYKHPCDVNTHRNPHKNNLCRICRTRNTYRVVHFDTTLPSH